MNPLPGGDREPHDRTASSIRPLCEQFINFADDRGQPLTVPGIDDAGTYRVVFKEIDNKPEAVGFSLRIFYGPIGFHKIVTSGDVLKVPLAKGTWSTEVDDSGNERRVLKKPVMVEIDMTNWPLRLRKRTTKEMKEAQRQQKERKKGEPGRHYVFFLGRRDQTDPFVFRVADARLVCEYFAEKIHTRRS